MLLACHSLGMGSAAAGEGAKKYNAIKNAMNWSAVITDSFIRCLPLNCFLTLGRL
jgi:hypothetical protein